MHPYDVDVPRKPMSNRVVRTTDEMWDEFQRIAAARDRVASEELRKMIAAYNRRHGKDYPKT